MLVGKVTNILATRRLFLFLLYLPISEPLCHHGDIGDICTYNLRPKIIECVHWMNIFNPRRTCAPRVTAVVLCVCVSVCLCLCVPIFSILPFCAFRRPMRGISSYSAENAVKLKSRFL